MPQKKDVTIQRPPNNREVFDMLVFAYSELAYYRRLISALAAECGLKEIIVPFSKVDEKTKDAIYARSQDFLAGFIRPLSPTEIILPPDLPETAPLAGEKPKETMAS